MSLEEVLKNSINNIGSGLARKEAHVKSQIIDPILGALGWDVHNQERVTPEYEVLEGKEGSADYALLRERKPVVFIEAKKLDGIQKAKKPGDKDSRQQLFDYYYADRRQDFLILTDGKRWDFYLARAKQEEKDLDSLLFHSMELANGEEIPKYASAFKKYLERRQIVSFRKALKAAETVYKNNRERKKTRDALPDVWLKMLGTPHQGLSTLLVKEIKNELKSNLKLLKPADLRKEVDFFLEGLVQGVSPRESKSTSDQSRSTSTREGDGSTSSQSTLVSFVIDGQKVEAKTAGEALAKVVKMFASRDPGFMERFALQEASKKKAGTVTRRLVARKRTELYLRSPHLTDKSINLGNGWWLGTNYDTARIERFIKSACEIAGAKFRGELKPRKRKR